MSSQCWPWSRSCSRKAVPCSSHLWLLGACLHAPLVASVVWPFTFSNFSTFCGNPVCSAILTFSCVPWLTLIGRAKFQLRDRDITSVHNHATITTRLLLVRNSKSTCGRFGLGFKIILVVANRRHTVFLSIIFFLRSLPLVSRSCLRLRSMMSALQQFACRTAMMTNSQFLLGTNNDEFLFDRSIFSIKSFPFCVQHVSFANFSPHLANLWVSEDTVCNPHVESRHR